MIDEEAIAGRLEAQDLLIATLFVAVVQAPVVTKAGLLAAMHGQADRVASQGRPKVATIIRHRIRDLREGL